MCTAGEIFGNGNAPSSTNCSDSYSFRATIARFSHDFASMGKKKKKKKKKKESMYLLVIYFARFQNGGK